MFKKKSKGENKPTQASPTLDSKIKYEKTLYDLKSRRDGIQDMLDKIDEKVEATDKEIRSLINQGKKQWAKIKLAGKIQFKVEMKGLQKQIESLQTKYNVLTHMIIQIETLEQDQGIAEAVQQAVDLAKDSEKTNEKLTDAMLDWQDFQVSSQETSELWKQMANMGVNQEELDEEFSKYEKENEQAQAVDMQQKLNTVPANKVPMQYQQQQMDVQLSDLLE